MSKVIIVTGANKGIGFAIVRTLAQQFKGHHVYLTARNEELGLKAVKELDSEGVKCIFHQLDVDNESSIQKFAQHIKATHTTGVDIFVHNAGIMYKQADTTPFAEQAVETVRVNFTASLNVWNAFRPLLRHGARWVNVSSRLGLLKTCKSPELRAKLNAPNATIEDVVGAMETFVRAAQSGEYEGISTSAYGMSKVGLTARPSVNNVCFRT
jgi:carbonyl reductase 1